LIFHLISLLHIKWGNVLHIATCLPANPACNTEN